MAVKLVNTIGFISFLLTIACILSFTSAECRSLQQFRFTSPLTYPSACLHILPYQTVFVEDGTFGECPMSPVSSYEHEIQKIVSIAGTQKLSSRCSSVIMMKHCSMVYKPCINDTDPTPLKPCRALCDALQDPAICSAKDRQQLVDFGFDMTRLNNCDDEDTWSRTDDECYGALEIPSIPSYPRCEPYTGSFCAGIAGFTSQQVYVPAGMVQSDLERRLEAEQYIFNSVSDLNGSRCARHLTTYLCSTYFPPCTTSATVPYAYPIPQYPCQSICENVSRDCNLLLLFFARDRPDLAPPICSSTTLFQDKCTLHPPPGQRVFPPETIGSIVRYEYPTPDVNTNISAVMSCSNHAAATAINPPFPSTCPAPLVLPDDPSSMRVNDGRCSLPCPTMLWSESNYHLFEKICDIFGIISLILGVFLIATLSLFKKQRHKRYVLFFTINATILSLVLFLGGRLKGSSPHTAASFCRTNTDVRVLDGFCGVQAIGIVFTLQAAVTFWLVQTVELFLRVVLSRKHDPNSREKRQTEAVYQIFAWGVPLASTLALIVGEFLGSSFGHPFCFISYEKYHSSYTKMSVPNVPLFTYFLPMCFMGVIGTILLGAVLFVLFRHRGTTGIRTSVFARLILYDIAVLVLITSIVAYDFYIDSRRSDWDLAVQEYAICLLRNPTMNGEQCKLHDSFPLALMIFFIVTLYSLGIVTFLIHGTSLLIYRAWAGVLYRLTGISWLESISIDPSLVNFDNSTDNTENTMMKASQITYTGTYAGSSTDMSAKTASDVGSGSGSAASTFTTIDPNHEDCYGTYSQLELTNGSSPSLSPSTMENSLFHSPSAHNAKDALIQLGMITPSSRTSQAVVQSNTPSTLTTSSSSTLLRGPRHLATSSPPASSSAITLAGPKHLRPIQPSRAETSRSMRERRSSTSRSQGHVPMAYLGEKTTQYQPTGTSSTPSSSYRNGDERDGDLFDPDSQTSSHGLPPTPTIPHHSFFAQPAVAADMTTQQYDTTTEQAGQDQARKDDGDNANAPHDKSEMDYQHQHDLSVIREARTVDDQHDPRHSMAVSNDMPLPQDLSLGNHHLLQITSPYDDIHPVNVTNGVHPPPNPSTQEDEE